ncbi:coiled-coil domain-containing protein 181 [Thunnus thynnus]|uniref:coiled-coil domain-containing protein 181 n=1 Tax=Thunnus maccoyii TaxID=8240 RepID=UPI001C4B12F1|nr:coiled-coil domain-containing protein 181 [Thunnus maccoyii]XP_042271637.1 coiled-coil domain-containing protein 181 [Thunnus maccoyii]XP_042271638.1 coiled-coil domain-containing protein 181 [Thunnus maccoyii]XP_042271639.1 coiled-coil domain-containing protein 181 [Thunnus maccoyii]
MTEVVHTKSQEEYEDDFEKDLDWLISEEDRSEDQGPDYEDIEAEIDKELEEDEKHQRMKRKEKGNKEEKSGNKTEELEEDEERWPSPMEPLEYDSDGDSPHKSSPIVPPPPGMDDQTEEDKKYILEKIQQANRELQDQEAPDMTRHRRLHFKETLVDLVVPPLQFEKDGNSEVEGRKDSKDRAKDAEEVSGKLSELKLSPREKSVGGCGGCSRTGDNSERGQGLKESRVLVEKDGKFDFVSLKEVESQGLLPPIANSYSSLEQTVSPGKIHTSSSSFSPHSRVGSSRFQQAVNHLQAPRPPAQPRNRPSSASHSQRGSQRRDTRRRVQSATGTPCQATYILTPEQKELRQKIQERKEKLTREAEQRKLEEEEQKKQENELAFKAWLMRKREQLQGERRIHRAQEMERMNSKRDSCDPEEAFRLWLQRKQEQQQRERQLVELKRLEEDGGYLLRSREDCERAFKLWLKRKREEKRAEQQAARERSRRLVLEERRARRMRDLMCTASETKSFRFTEQLAYRF